MRKVCSGSDIERWQYFLKQARDSSIAKYQAKRQGQDESTEKQDGAIKQRKEYFSSDENMCANSDPVKIFFNVNCFVPSEIRALYLEHGKTQRSLSLLLQPNHLRWMLNLEKYWLFASLPQLQSLRTKHQQLKAVLENEAEARFIKDDLEVIEAAINVKKNKAYRRNMTKLQDYQSSLHNDIVHCLNNQLKNG